MCVAVAAVLLAVLAVLRRGCVPVRGRGPGGLLMRADRVRLAVRTTGALFRCTAKCMLALAGWLADMDRTHARTRTRTHTHTHTHTHLSTRI